MKTAIRSLAALCLISLPSLTAGELKLDEDLRELIPAEQVKALETAETTLRATLASHKDSTDSETAKAEKEITALLDAPRVEIASRDKLVGRWKVRSLQLVESGLYAYPFFTCEFTPEAAIGLNFRKDSGSQRRAGNVFAHDKTTRIFSGHSYYADESPGNPGERLDAKTDTNRESFGLLYQLAPGHLIILFAPTPFGSEIYELKKS